MLRDRLGGQRIIFTGAERRQLAAKARALGCEELRELGTIVTRDTHCFAGTGNLPIVLRCETLSWSAWYTSMPGWHGGTGSMRGSDASAYGRGESGTQPDGQRLWRGPAPVPPLEWRHSQPRSTVRITTPGYEPYMDAPRFARQSRGHGWQVEIAAIHSAFE